MGLKHLVIIIFIAYIFATQQMMSGYIDMNNSLSDSLAKLMNVCSNANSSDLNNRYKDLTD